MDCFNVEYGHVQLPLEVADRLRDRLGPKASDFKTVEHVFSGRGFATVKQFFEPDKDQPSPEFYTFYVRLLALLTRNLILAFLPSNGVFFAGAVARNVLSSTAREDFIRIIEQPFELDARLTAPVYSILDDAAALKGCSNYLMRG